MPTIFSALLCHCGIGRVMVPIFDSDGRNIIAFGGRHLDNPLPSSKKNTTGNFKAAKYLNSPESLVFQKKKVLFGFNEATKQMNERDFNLEINQDLDPDSDENIADLLSRSTFDEKPAVNFLIVEGYFDALALYDAGVKYVTASMGTALTKDQLEMVAQRLGKQTKGNFMRVESFIFFQYFASSLILCIFFQNSICFKEKLCYA